MLAIVLVVVAGGLRILAHHTGLASTSSTREGTLGQTFTKAAREFQVPVELLKAICYMEGRLSNNDGRPSVDNGYGCMHLIQNSRGDLLNEAANTLKVSVAQLKQDLPTNIRGGAALLRAYALQASPTHRLPADLSGWYGAVAVYSHATTRATALMYADAVYGIIADGFSAETDSGETITLGAQRVQPDVQSAATIKGVGALPSGCVRDQKVDYPQAVDCLLAGKTYDCNRTQPKAPCNFEGAQRPGDYAIDQIVVHDIEGNALASLSVFQNPKTQASAHYIIDGDGTIYQVVREKDIAYHAGNYWYNQHSIGIEHAGMDATGYRWYSAGEYLASAKLTAYLLKKYKLPLNHEQIVSHGTIPSPSATNLPNHVDPGPYWLWDYYLKLIHEQGVSYPEAAADPNVFTLHPSSARHPLGKHGKESRANFNFFSLYTGPSTASSRIPQLGHGHDITDVSGNVEPDISYYYLAKVADPAGSGATLYKIWYGVVDHPTQDKRNAHARQVWLAVPRGSTARGQGVPVTLHPDGGKTPLIYGQPTTDSAYLIGDAPAGSVFVSTYTVNEDSPASGNNDNNTKKEKQKDADKQGTPGSDKPKKNDTKNKQDNQNNAGNQDDTGDQDDDDLDDPGDLDGLGFLRDMGIFGVVHPNGYTGSAGRRWYEINYNHRQGWVPASEVTLTPDATPKQKP